MRKGKPNNLATTHHYSRVSLVILSTDLRRGTSALSPSRRSLRSVGTSRPVVPTSRLSTVGSRVFPVADPQTWNDFPEDVISRIIGHISSSPQDTSVQEVFS